MLKEIRDHIIHFPPDISWKEGFPQAKREIGDWYLQLVKLQPMQGEQAAKFPEVPWLAIHTFDIPAQAFSEEIEFESEVSPGEEDYGVSRLRDSQKGKLYVYVWFPTEDTIERQVQTAVQLPPGHQMSILYTRHHRESLSGIESLSERELFLQEEFASSRTPSEIQILIHNGGGYSVLYKNYDNSMQGVGVENNGSAHIIPQENLPLIFGLQ